MTDEEWVETKPARKKPVTLGHRSLKWLKDQGFLCQSVEQTIRYPDRQNPGRMKIFKRDVWNIADIIAVGGGLTGTLYVQVTDTSNQAARFNKISGIPAAYRVLEAGNHIWILGWGKKGPRGKRKLWEVTVNHVTIDENHIMRRQETVQQLDETGEPVESLF